MTPLGNLMFIFIRLGFFVSSAPQLCMKMFIIRQNSPSSVLTKIDLICHPPLSSRFKNIFLTFLSVVIFQNIAAKHAGTRHSRAPRHA